MTPTLKFPHQAATFAAAGTAQVGLLAVAAGPLAFRAEDGGIVVAAKVVLDDGHKGGHIAVLKRGTLSTNSKYRNSIFGEILKFSRNHN